MGSWYSPEHLGWVVLFFCWAGSLVWRLVWCMSVLELQVSVSLIDVIYLFNLLNLFLRPCSVLFFPLRFNTQIAGFVGRQCRGPGSCCPHGGRHRDESGEDGGPCNTSMVLLRKGLPCRPSSLSVRLGWSYLAAWRRANPFFFVL